ncbi:hypothetical protein TNCT_592741 [Trichonephila clavata]|uniref:Uncharacterized protein n=1 Tax=Trichonephila clavata TaxID=2740835 RepID=A0A8X6HSK5_TRICU|nr:hypothetical protein TNCT_592741 [Trichonephila clavata]
MEDLEGNRKQKLLDTRKRQFTCGWTSEELGWQREERRRQWGGTTEIGLRNWLVDRYRKENSNQSLAEGSLKRYLRELNLAADLTPNLDGCLYSGDAIQVRGSGGLLLAALPRDVDERGKYLSPCRATATADARTLRRTSFRVLRRVNTISSCHPFTDFFFSNTQRSNLSCSPLLSFKPATVHRDSPVLLIGAACPMFLSALQTPSFDIAVLRTMVEVIAVVTLRCSRSAAERIPSDGHIAAVANV